MHSRLAIEYQRLYAIDWTFSDASTRGQTHGIHPYPAKFIPQISRTLIQHLHPRDGSAILDPFCGSGTTLVEAALAGIPALGIDLHPLACLMSKVKVTPLKPGTLSAAASRVVGRANSIDRQPPPIPRLDHWFKRDVQEALTALTTSIDEEVDSAIRDALKIALSSIIVRVSNQESDTRYAAVEKDVGAEEVGAFFLRAADRADEAISGTWGGLFPPPPVRVLNRDILEVTPEEIERPISLVITSPPYPNAYEYWLYHKYRMYWLGMDPIAVREREIGARSHYFRSKPQTAEDFFDQMSRVFGLLREVVVVGGHVCFQVGASVIRGKLVDNAEILTAAAAEHRFTAEVRLNRSIPEVRSAFNPRHGRIRDEAIIVFRR